MRPLALCLLAGSLAACSTSRRVEAPPAASYVDESVTAAEARTLAAPFATLALRRANGPVEVVPAGAGDPLAPALTSAIQGGGGSVAGSGLAAAHRLSYRVAPIGEALIASMTLDQTVASQPFARTRGALAPLGPMAVVEAE